ncbi:hypothetical protein PoB_007630900 [Plakobranchus ocellatus]|uniref:Uncharacterized protein n=1 Tax=Plakobranchus ocellatus TaxID=259542 RepID=A0AAV4E0I1_9GAST|nr:hypothetical protein PoB_007630900 [Plakobranchus ocellatus]
MILFQARIKGVSDILYIASSQQGDPRLSGPPSGQGDGGGARTRDRTFPSDLSADLPATVPPTFCENKLGRAKFQWVFEEEIALMMLLALH